MLAVNRSSFGFSSDGPNFMTYAYGKTSQMTKADPLLRLLGCSWILMEQYSKKY